MQLYRKYRPRRLPQIVGQSAAVRKVRAVIDRAGYDGGALWIGGKTGTGKTTLAQVIANELSNRGLSPVERRAVADTRSWTYTEIDGDKCSVEVVRDLDGQAQTGACPWADTWRVWIVNEAQAMTGRAVQAWLTLLERLPSRWVVIFTSTVDQVDLFGDFAGPFSSRCVQIRLTNQGLATAFARLVHGIARREGLNGHPRARYEKLAKDLGNNCRAMLQAVESGELLD